MGRLFHTTEETGYQPTQPNDTRIQKKPLIGDIQDGAPLNTKVF